MKYRLRTFLLATGGFVAALVIAAIIATYVVLQPERFTSLLQARAKAAGLSLTLASPATPTLWPSPALELDGVTLRLPDGGTPLVVASRGKLVLPWRTLMGRDTSISRLEVEGARIDMDAVSAYLDTLPKRPSTAGAALPTIDAGFHISRGTLLRGNRLVLSNVEADAGRLASGRRFSLSLAAATDDGHPYQLVLATLPTLRDGVLTLDDLTLDMASPEHFETNLKGSALWRGGADVGASLAGRLSLEKMASYAMLLNVTPANQEDPLYIALKLDGETGHADLRVPPLALADWWAGVQAGSAPALPPALGSADVEAVDAGSVQVKGLRIRATPNVPVSASSSAPASGSK
ncbi:membrane assembly protein AsmA [Luteibacter aegosomatissinici]|uniref:membrane assembly protein AsmA n=1 Tax=Luteibacter aegosomatissinici TaxID=2911539 RepID=UPI001FF9DFE8|nr:membrane assembly protein AsmA [Luteibacter aegosomatissinici]UPG93520.1 membrane assembly protein AsmA [Luteibacter aegosomatissinici]